MDFQENWFDDIDIPELRHYVRRPSLTAANGFFWGTAAMFAVFQAVIPVFYWLLNAVWDISRTGYTTAAQMLMYVGGMLMPVMIYMLSRPAETEAFRLRPAPAKRTWLSAAAALPGYLAAAFLSVLWLVLLETLGLRSTANDIMSGSLFVDLLVISLMPALCEELLFRGLILGAYERWGTWRAIWISAFMFASMHGSVAGFPVHLLLGVVLGFVAASTGSVVPGMALHAVYNAVAVILSYVSAGQDTGVYVPMIEQIGGAMGVAACFTLTLVSIGLFLWVLRALDRMRIRADEPFGTDAVIEHKKMDRTEIILLASGIATVIWFYVQDILSML